MNVPKKPRHPTYNPGTDGNVFEWLISASAIHRAACQSHATQLALDRVEGIRREAREHDERIEDEQALKLAAIRRQYGPKGEKPSNGYPKSRASEASG